MIRSYKEEQELKEKILELRKKNYPYDKIAMELGTNESRVKLIIGLLVEEGKLDSLATNLYKKETEEKLKQILSMAKAKRNVSEISSSLGISVDRTYLYVDRLVEEGRLSIAEVYQCADEEIEKRVIELRKAGLGQREIMKEMKITKQDTLRRILDKLFSEGKIDSYKKVDKTKKRIVELLKYGYNAEEISRQLVKDEQKIRILMAELIRDGVVTQDEITQAREAKKAGKLVCWSASVAPPEMCVAMDIAMVYPETHAAGIGARKGSLDMLAVAEQKGYNLDICSYARVNLGYIAILKQEAMTGETPEKLANSPAARVPLPDLVIT